MREKRTPVPNWLKALQENSWELELLISGGAVFTLVQAPDLFQDWIMKINSIYNLAGISVIFITGIFSIKVLTNGFILHLLLRAFWLALVCINYVFPQGINSEKVKLKYPFRNLNTEGDLQDQIMKVDRISGMVIFMSIIGTIITIGIAGILIGVIFTPSNIYSFLDPFFEKSIAIIFFISFFIYIIDLLAMGFFRRIPYISFLLFPFFIVYDFLSLRPFYGRALVLFSSNVKRWSFRLGALIFTMVTYATTRQSVSHFLHHKSLFDNRIYTEKLSKNYSVQDGKYEDKRTENEQYSSVVFIPSRIIENNFLTVGISYRSWMDRLISSSTKLDSLKYMDRIFEVFIDDSLYSNITWRGKHNFDFPSAGIEGLVNISNLPNGEHILKVKFKDFPEAEYKKILSHQEFEFPVNVPFCKDVF